MLFRTEAQKRDQAWNWNRGDRAFFASGACHVLAHEFLRRREAQGFSPWEIAPAAGFRGSHVFASDGDVVFDYHGWSRHAAFVEHHVRKLGRFFPGWHGDVREISGTFWTEEWFATSQSRRPSQYYRDPTARANAFIDRLSAVRGNGCAV